MKAVDLLLEKLVCDCPDQTMLSRIVAISGATQVRRDLSQCRSRYFAPVKTMSACAATDQSSVMDFGADQLSHISRNSPQVLTYSL